MEEKVIRMKLRRIEHILTGIQSPNRILPNSKTREARNLNELIKDCQSRIDELNNITEQGLFQDELDLLEAERRSVLSELTRPELPLFEDYC